MAVSTSDPYRTGGDVFAAISAVSFLLGFGIMFLGWLPPPSSSPCCQAPPAPTASAPPPMTMMATMMMITTIMTTAAAVPAIGGENSPRERNGA